MKKYEIMTPYELGESNEEEAINYLIKYLAKGNGNEKRLAASAIKKLSINYKAKCNKALPFLLENLKDIGPQVRQYTLNALSSLDISEEAYVIIEHISRNDSKEYNRRIAKDILNKNPIKNEINDEPIKGLSNKELLKRIFIKDVYKEEIFNSLREYCDKYKILTLWDLDKININEVTSSFSIKKRILQRQKSIIFNEKHLKSFNYIDNKLLEDVFSKNEELKRNKFKNLNKAITSNEILNIFHGNQFIKENHKEFFSHRGREFITLLFSIAERELIEEKALELLILRYSIDNKYCTLGNIGTRYNLSVEEVETLINKLLNRVGRNIHRALKNHNYEYPSLDLFYFTYELLDYNNKRCFLERASVFIKYGFPHTHSKLIMDLIIIILEGRRIPWKSESINLSYGKLCENIHNLEKQQGFSNKIIDSVQWSKKIRFLKEQEYLKVRTIRLMEEKLKSKGKSYYSDKLSKTIYYKDMIEKDYIDFLEQCNEVVYYAIYPFKLKGIHEKDEFIIVDLFFVLSDGRGVVILFNNKDFVDNVKFYAIKEQIEEKGLGLWLINNKQI